MKRILFLLLLSCATTEEFRLRVEGASLYRNCLSIYGEKRLCTRETARWCMDQGLEPSCFVDYTDRPSCR
jgi:hypothetical protein